MVNVVVVAKILVVVAHVIAGVDVEILTLAIGNGELVSLGNRGVLAEVSAKKRTVGQTVVVLEYVLVEESNSEKGKKLPTDGHTLEEGNTVDSLEAEPEASSPGEAAVAVEGLVKKSKALTILQGYIVGEKVGRFSIGAVDIEPFKAVVLNEVLLEPGSSGDLGNATEVSEG